LKISFKNDKASSWVFLVAASWYPIPTSRAPCATTASRSMMPSILQRELTSKLSRQSCRALPAGGYGQRCIGLAARRDLSPDRLADSPMMSPAGWPALVVRSIVSLLAFRASRQAISAPRVMLRLGNFDRFGVHQQTNREHPTAGSTSAVLWKRTNYQYAAGGTCRPDLLNRKTNEGTRLVARAKAAGLRMERRRLQPGFALTPRSPAACRRHSTAKRVSPMASSQRSSTGALANPREFHATAVRAANARCRV